LGAGVVLLVQASDRSRAEQAFQKLDEVMENRYRFVVQKSKMGSQPVVNWTSPLGGVSVTHGWLEGNVAFLTLGAPIANAIAPQPLATLTQTELFQQAVPTKPNPNNSQFFLDVDRIINSGKLNLQLSPEQKMLAKAIRAIGVTGSINDERSSRFDLFVQLKTLLSPSPSGATQRPTVSPSSSPSPSATTQRPAVSPSSSPSPSGATQRPAASPSSSPTPSGTKPPEKPPLSPSR
jgi:hypothetical protein